jgi:protein-tyrosine phosphatase
VKVLFVCTANICRSPMVAAWFAKRAAAAGLAHVSVDSAGLLGLEGRPAAPEVVSLLRPLGCDLVSHRSRGVRPSDLASADLVVAMELRHLEELHVRNPHLEAALLLRAFEHGPEPSRGAPDLDDPIGGPPAAYAAAFEKVRACVEGLVLHLRHHG